MEVGWNVFTLNSLSPRVAASFKGSLPFPAAKATELDGLIDGPEIAAHYHLHYILKQEEEEAQTSESKVPICESQRQRRVRKSGRLISKWEVESPRRQTLFPVRECHTQTLADGCAFSCALSDTNTGARGWHHCFAAFKLWGQSPKSWLNCFPAAAVDILRLSPTCQAWMQSHISFPLSPGKVWKRLKAI